MKNTTSKRTKTLSDGTKVVHTKHPFEGLPNGEERLAKVRLAGQINDLIESRKLTQKQAAKVLRITQPEVSSLSKGRISGFTFDRLYRCLIALNVDVEISLKKHSARAKKPAGVYVHA